MDVSPAFCTSDTFSSMNILDQDERLSSLISSCPCANPSPLTTNLQTETAKLIHYHSNSDETKTLFSCTL